MRAANLALRFALELCAFAGLAYWGAELEASTAIRIVVAVAAPALAIGVWGAWIAPKAGARLADPSRLLAEVGVFTAAAVAVACSAGATWAVGFAALVLLNELLMLRWGQRDTA